MNGVISGETLTGTITTNETLTGKLTTPKSLQKYTGDYTIQPTTSEIVLETKDKETTDNIIINAIQPPSWTKIAETDANASNLSIDETLLVEINTNGKAYTKDKIIYVRIRDKAGKRNGYFVGSDCFFINDKKANDTTNLLSIGMRGTTLYSANNGGYKISTAGSSTGYGVYARSIKSDGVVQIYTKYSSNAGSVNGTYHIEVYTLEYPDGISPFDI